MVKRFDVTSHDDVGIIVLGNGTDDPVLEVGLIGPVRHTRMAFHKWTDVEQFHQSTDIVSRRPLLAIMLAQHVIHVIQ